jgi:hypothetical protein
MQLVANAGGDLAEPKSHDVATKASYFGCRGLFGRAAHDAILPLNNSCW